MTFRFRERRARAIPGFSFGSGANQEAVNELRRSSQEASLPIWSRKKSGRSRMVTLCRCRSICRIGRGGPPADGLAKKKVHKKTRPGSFPGLFVKDEVGGCEACLLDALQPDSGRSLPGNEREASPLAELDSAAQRGCATRAGRSHPVRAGSPGWCPCPLQCRRQTHPVLRHRPSIVASAAVEIIVAVAAIGRVAEQSVVAVSPKEDVIPHR